MIKKEQINVEVKIGKVVVDDNGQYFVEEYDKEGELINEISLETLLDDLVDKEYVNIKINYMKEI